MKAAASLNGSEAGWSSTSDGALLEDAALHSAMATASTVGQRHIFQCR